MRILVVDDSGFERLALRGMLERAGFTVIEAKDGDEGLRIFRSMGADLVLCDMLMPRCNGLQAVRELRHSWPTVKIVGMSGARNEGKADMLQTALYLGADDVLYKPFDPATLIATIKEVLQMQANPNCGRGLALSAGQ